MMIFSGDLPESCFYVDVFFKYKSSVLEERLLKSVLFCKGLVASTFPCQTINDFKKSTPWPLDHLVESAVGHERLLLALMR